MIDELEQNLKKAVTDTIYYANLLRSRTEYKDHETMQLENERLMSQINDLKTERSRNQHEIESLENTIAALNLETSEYWEIKSLANLYEELIEQYETMLDKLSPSIKIDNVTDEILYDRAKDRVRLLKVSIKDLKEGIALWRK